MPPQSLDLRAPPRANGHSGAPRSTCPQIWSGRREALWEERDQRGRRTAARSASRQDELAGARARKRSLGCTAAFAKPSVCRRVQAESRSARRPARSPRLTLRARCPAMRRGAGVWLRSGAARPEVRRRTKTAPKTMGLALPKAGTENAGNTGGPWVRRGSAGWRICNCRRVWVLAERMDPNRGHRLDAHVDAKLGERVHHVGVELRHGDWRQDDLWKRPSRRAHTHCR